MDYIEEPDSQWDKRESKKMAKKRFTTDNRKSVRWLEKKAGEKAREIQKTHAKKKKETLQGEVL
tara:strand:+ start:594 stop:785 length:192 start_codon:yes stop_codon:yes gene_type:complete